MKTFKVYGIQRSGTNFLTQCLLRNFEGCRVLRGANLGPKHGTPVSSIDGVYEWFEKAKNKYPPERFDNPMLRKLAKDLKEGKMKITPCVMIKNPYSWHWSIEKRKLNLGHISEPEKYYPKNYNIFNDRYREWKDLVEHGDDIHATGIFVKYEDLIENTNLMINKIATNFNIETVKEFIIPTKVPHSVPFTEKRKQFYLQDGNFGLSDEQVKWITDNVDWDLMKYYGYTPKG